jgi:hypothetical protein
MNTNPTIIDFKKLSLTSLIFGFFLIPIHEFGHVLCDWITGHPAAMSYARDYLLREGNTPFLGLLGGPLLPIIIALFAVTQIHRRVNLSIYYPIAVLGSIDRLILYISGMLPSDERDLAGLAGWDINSFKYIFLSLEMIVLVLIVISLYRWKIGIKRSCLIVVIPLISFIIGALIGVFVIERFVFPQQFAKQFG